MPRALVLAENPDHLLRFFFVASICVKKPRAGNEQEKMVVPRYRAPPSVCFPEIALGLGLRSHPSCCSHLKKKKKVSK